MQPINNIRTKNLKICDINIKMHVLADVS